MRTDVGEFDAAIDAARLADPERKAELLMRAVQHYGGPLLPGYYETWVLAERDRIDAAYLSALQQLAGLMERAGDADQALDFARRAVAADPLREESHAAVIRLLMESGQAAAAKRQFEEMARVFQEKLDMRPSPATEALLRGESPIRPARPLPAEPRSAGPLRVESPKTATADLPPSVSLPARPAAEAHRLPLSTTRFFGREDEIAALQNWLLSPDTRLVTVTGPGGSGKTRIAVETVRTLGRDFGGGIWYVPLADLSEAERIPDAIADALELPRRAASRTPLLNQIADRLRESDAFDTGAAPLLLVLDNFEHVADEGAVFVAALLEMVPHLHCLVTSRQRLRLESEREFPLLPLPVPEFPGSPDRLNEFASVQLFVSRARTALADFQLTNRNAASVAALCTKLEGIPLAIELAAAWSGTLTPAQMLQKMERRMDLLVSRRRDVSVRHRTLRAAIESSVSLLPPDARRFFASLSVFRGGWTLEAVETMFDEPDALDLLTTLRDHSLVVASVGEEGPVGEDDGTLRFRMLETLREYALEMAHADDPTGAAVAEMEARHAACFSRLVDEAAPHLSEHDQASWLRQLEAEHQNIRAAMDTLTRRGEWAALLRMTGKLVGLWFARGRMTEGRQRLAAALAGAGDDAPALLRAVALGGSGKLAHMQGEYDAAREFHRASLALYRAEGDRRGISSVLNEMGNGEMKQSNYAAAEALFQESLAGFRALGDKKGIALALNNLGANLVEWGRPGEARRYLEESLPLHREIGHHRLVAVTLLNLGSIAQFQRDLPQARALFEQSLAIRRELGDAIGVGRALESLGTLCLEEGDIDAAMRRFDESLAVRREIQDRNGIASLCLNRGLALIYRVKDSAGAWASLAECLNLLRQTGNKRHIAYALEGMASVVAARKQPKRAVELWAVAAALRESISSPRETEEAKELEAELEAVRAGMGERRFAASWAAGYALPMTEAMTLALDDRLKPA